MRHNIWLLSAFTLAATLTLGGTDADAASKKSAKPAPALSAYEINTRDCEYAKPVPAKNWAWKNSRLTVEFIKSEDGKYTKFVLPGAINPDEKLPLASITKLMTALVVLDAMDRKKIDPDQMIPVSHDSLCLADNRFAVVGLPAGIKEISVGDALTHNLKLSSNTMAMNLAVATAGSVPAFVNLMNAKAKEWGMTNTHFVNPHGLPEGDRKSEYTTAKDMLIMSEHILQQFGRFKTYSNAPLEPWIFDERSSHHQAKKQLSGLGAIFKTGTINKCASLLTMAEMGENRLVDIELCGGSQTRFQNALAAVKGGLKRFAGMMSTEAMAATVPQTNAKIERVSLRQARP